MKKIFLLSIALCIALVGIAQKKELRNISKAIKKGELNDAKEQVNALESSINSADVEQQAEFYLYKGQVYAGLPGSNEENLTKAGKALRKVVDMEAANNNQQYTQEALQEIQNVRVKIVNAAVADQNNERFEAAAKKLYSSYKMSPRDTSDLYFAASNALNAQKYDFALELYEELIDLGYTGREQVFTAISKETGEEESFANKQERDLMVMSGEYVKPGKKTTGSRKFEIYRMAAVLYVENDDMKSANEILNKARMENPEKDLEILQIEADIALRSNDMGKYGKLMKKIVQTDPDNPQLYFNLGVSAAELGQTEEAIGYYKKAIELKPDYTEANLNLAVTILDQEAAIVEEMNSLGMSPAENKRYDELKSERTKLYEDAIPYLETAYQQRQDDIQIVQTLMNMYMQIGKQDKADKMKAKLDTLRGN